jgi:hypothetical protein
MAAGVLGSASVRFLISQSNKLSPSQAVVCNGVDMAVNFLAVKFFGRRSSNVGEVILASRITGILSAALATVAIGKPVNLRLAAALNISSFVTSLVLNCATSPKTHASLSDFAVCL